MIRYGQKITTEGFVPVRDHFREIIAITPVRMDVKDCPCTSFGDFFDPGSAA